MRQEFVSKNFSPDVMAIIKRADQILREYARQGYDLTLRQLYYQFVARDIIANKQTEYKRLGSIINDARLAGLIDWDHITDRTRNLQSLSHWGSPADIVEACARSYHIDRWEGQKYQVEVWIEKDALVGVIENVCNRFDVPFFSCRGYTSQSEMYVAAQRLIEYDTLKNRMPVVIHLGDHDPSGIDMTRDITERLELFNADCEVKRIALTMDQIEKYDPPPNPVKITDSRCKRYIEEYGEDCWELDALEPAVITELIKETIKDYIQPDLWATTFHKQAKEKSLLRLASEKWPKIAKNLIKGKNK